MTARPRFRSHVDVTPLVDVALVLLVVFLVMTPMMRAAHPVALPESGGPPIVPAHAPIVVHLATSGAIEISGQRLDSPAELPRRIAELLRTTRAERVFVSVDDAVPYEDALATLDAIQKAAPDGRRVPIGLVVTPPAAGG